jgi:hypothetical protein
MIAALLVACTFGTTEPTPDTADTSAPVEDTAPPVEADEDCYPARYVEVMTCDDAGQILIGLMPEASLLDAYQVDGDGLGVRLEPAIVFLDPIEPESRANVTLTCTAGATVRVSILSCWR